MKTKLILLGFLAGLLVVSVVGMSLSSSSGTVTIRGNMTVAGYLTQTNNVKAFGAVGDGVTDDTTAISNALASAASAVYFPQGTYLTDSLLVTNAALFGSGFSSKLVLKSPTTQTLLTCGENVTISDLWMDGGSSDDFNTGSPTKTTTCINHWSVGDGGVRNVRISGFTYGVKINGPNDITARSSTAIYAGNFITNCYAAFNCLENNAAEYTTITGNSVKNCYIGLYNQSAANLCFTGNSLKDGQYGIWVNGGARAHSLYSGNVINHFFYPVRTTTAQNPAFVGNTMLGNKAGGSVNLQSSTGVILDGNIIETAANFLLFSSGGKSNIIRNNMILGSVS